MSSSAVLVAGDVRTRLFDALGPVWRATLAGLAADPALGADAEDSAQLLVQLSPFVVRVVLTGDASRPARELAMLPGEALPDDGEALHAAALDVLAGVLSSQAQKAGLSAVACAQAQQGRGGFVLQADPNEGTVGVLLAVPGRPLDAAVVLGGLGEAPGRAH